MSFRGALLTFVTFSTLTGFALGSGLAQAQPLEGKGCYEMLKGRQVEFCRNFAANLNKFCDVPPMACEMRIDPSFAKEFSLPKWELMDAAANFELLGKIYRGTVPTPVADPKAPQSIAWRQKRWEEYQPELRRKIEAGKIRLSRARVDLNNDGKKELVYRIDDMDQCNPADPTRRELYPGSPILTVLNARTGEADEQYSRAMTSPKPVIYRRGHVYLVEWYGPQGGGLDSTLDVYETGSAHNVGVRFGRSHRALCEFRYLPRRP